MFVIYIDDLLANIKSEGFLFVDDGKIFHQITSRKDALLLQSDLSLLEQWSEHWLLNFHPDKCHVLTLGTFDNIRHMHSYHINDTGLAHVFKEKDLGITMDGDLSFEEHISLKVKKAIVVMGEIRRSFPFLDGCMFKKLYITFVRPTLNCCSGMGISPCQIHKYTLITKNFGGKISAEKISAKILTFSSLSKIPFLTIKILIALTEKYILKTVIRI